MQSQVIIILSAGTERPRAVCAPLTCHACIQAWDKIKELRVAGQADEDEGEEAKAERLKKQRQQEQARRARKSGGRPFPPRHYVASLAELEGAEFPLPAMGPDGQLACPEGYVATRPGGTSPQPATSKKAP
jgi:hypothetical protein